MKLPQLTLISEVLTETLTDYRFKEQVDNFEPVDIAVTIRDNDGDHHRVSVTSEGDVSVQQVSS